MTAYFQSVYNDNVVKGKELSFQKGQIALIIILIMVVVGTIALSVASRSVIDIGISKQEEEKIRAFSKAEAGIEDLLAQGLAIGEGTDVSLGDITYSYKIEEVGAGTAYELDESLANGETTQIILEGAAPKPTSLRFCWVNGREETGTKASLEISVFNSDYSVNRYAINAPGGASDNGFESGSEPPGGQCGGSGKYQAYKQIINITDAAQFVRIKALYNEAFLGVWAVGGQLPAQAYKARVVSQEGESTAAVEVVQSLPAHAGIFDYVLWSGGGLNK